MTKVDITYPGDIITKSITALVKQPVSPSSATPIDIGLVEINHPTQMIPGPPGSVGPPGPGVTVSDTPPASPDDGDLWWESDTGILWTWYIDADSAQWVQISGGVGGPETDLPITPQMFGAAGDGTTDDTAAFQAAAAAGVDLYVPAGRYKITDMVTIQNNRTWQGAGRTRAVIYVPDTFNLSALGVIRLGTNAVGGASLFDIGFEFYQDNTVTTRAAVIHYPPAIYVAGMPRAQIDRIRITSAWDGIDASANAGGLWIGRVEIGAFNRGLWIDGALDFVHGESWHFWPFGIAGQPIDAVYYDNATIATEIGFVESLSVDKISTHRAKLVFPPSAQTIGTRHIGIVQIDGNGARIVHNTNPTSIGLLYSTKEASTTLSDIECDGGRLTIGTVMLTGAPSAAQVWVKPGGILQINGGTIQQAAVGQSAVLHTGGNCTLNGVSFILPAANRTEPYVRCDNGALTVKGCNVNANVANTGPLVSIAGDAAAHDVSSNHFGAFSLVLPAGAYAGCYGPNRLAAMSFTPVLTFATPGDLAYTATIATGKYYWETNGYRLHIRFVVSGAITHTTASGELRIGGLPAANKGIETLSVNIARWSMIDLSAGYTMIAGSVTTNTDYIVLSQHGDNQATATITTTSIPTGTTGFAVTIDGFVPTQ